MAPGRRSGGGILGSLRRSFAPPTAAQCRRAFASGAARRPPRGSDLEAAWASLAAYDSTAAGKFLNRKAKKAKESLRGAGFERAAKFEVCNGVSMSFDNTVEVEDWDAAHLWLRESDGRGILAFRGSDSQKNLEHVRCDRVAEVYGHKLHAEVAEGEFAPLVATMSPGDFSSCATLVATGHSLGGGCASLLAVLMNDKADPLGFGAERKHVDELYGFGATPVFHNSERETPNEYGCNMRGAFPGAIYRTLRMGVDGREVQDRAFNLATKNFHYPKTGLVSLRSAKTAPVAYQSSGVQGAPRWRAMVHDTPLDDELFPLHNPYVQQLPLLLASFHLKEPVAQSELRELAGHAEKAPADADGGAGGAHVWPGGRGRAGRVVAALNCASRAASGASFKLQAEPHLRRRRQVAHASCAMVCSFNGPPFPPAHGCACTSLARQLRLPVFTAGNLL